jgi:hypothetical protein
MTSIKTLTAFNLFAEVEIATPREGSTTGSHLHEGMLLRAFQDGDSSSELLEGSMDTKRETFRMVRMLTRMEEEDFGDLPEFILTDAEGRQEFEKASGLTRNSLYWSDSALLHSLGASFPNGVILSGISQVDGADSIFLDFAVLASMATVIGGTAEGIAAEALAVVCLALNPDKGGVDQAILGKIAHLNAGIQGWLSGAVQSHSILKRLMRGRKGRKVGGKIRNASHIPCLNHEAGEIPKLGMSIKDDRLKVLAKGPDGKVLLDFLDDQGNLVKEKMHQAVLGIGRAPMPMSGAVELILLEMEGEEGEPGTDVICGDGFGFQEPNSSTETRKMTLSEMRRLRDGNLTNPENPDDVGVSMGTNAVHEGDSDGDGDELELLSP